MLILPSLWFACQAPAPDPASDPESVGETDPTDDTSTADTATDATSEPSADCWALAPMPAVGVPVPGFVPGEYAAVHEDFTFGPEGRIVSVHSYSGVLQAADIDAAVTPLVPGFERGIKGITGLPDGRLAIVDPNVGAVRLVDPETGAQETVGSDLRVPNGIILGPDGALYVTTYDDVVRIDLDGTSEIVTTAADLDLDGIAFSPDGYTMYVDHPSGIVYRSTRTTNGSWTTPQQFAVVPLDLRGLIFDVADGLVTDVCGNLYVVGMRGWLVRFTPDGEMDGATALAGAEYELFSAVRFGPGAGGFDAQTAYVTGLQGAVVAVPIGVGGMPR